MKLDRVTITGADDTVAPWDLFALSERFPFVEWGILVSLSQMGSKRFPSSSWLQVMAQDARQRREVRFSLHLCGRWMRDVLVGMPAPLANIKDAFRRVQLNFHGERQAHNEFMVDAIADLGVEEAIFQIDGCDGETIMRAAGKSSHSFRCAPLFDLSHGAGVSPASWPAPLDPAGYQGYAGGLGPENLADQIPAIARAAGEARVWIDMETRVRSSNDRFFDLSKVRRCLEIAEDFVERPAAP